MTVIVGIKCSDGVVMGADSMATYGPPFGQSTIQQDSVKLDILGGNLALGVSGQVGIQQSYSAEIASTLKNTGGRANWKTVAKAKDALVRAMWKHAEAVWERAGTVAKSIPAAAQQCMHHSMIAFPIEDTPYLVQFNHQCDPEEATTSLPFVSIGSGQPTADPFLAFIRDVFWPKRELPTLNDGIFAAIWTLTHTIKTSPGGVGGNIQIVTLSKNDHNKWGVRELPHADFGEHQQMIQRVEEGMRKTTAETFSADPTGPIPEKPMS